MYRHCRYSALLVGFIGEDILKLATAVMGSSRRGSTVTMPLKAGYIKRWCHCYVITLSPSKEKPSKQEQPTASGDRSRSSGRNIGAGTVSLVVTGRLRSGNLGGTTLAAVSETSFSTESRVSTAEVMTSVHNYSVLPFPASTPTKAPAVTTNTSVAPKTATSSFFFWLRRGISASSPTMNVRYPRTRGIWRRCANV